MPATLILEAIGYTVAGTAAAAAGATVLSAAAYAAAAFAINFAASYVITRIFGSQPPGQTDPGVRQQIPPNSTNSLPVVYGDAWLGGTFVDAVLSTDQKTMYYVLAISNISTSGQFSFNQSQFYYGDRLVTFDGTDTTKVVSLTDGSGNVDTKISGNLYINLYTSTVAGVITSINGSAPNVVMGGSDIDSTLRWPASGRQMNGLAFAIIKLIYNRDAGTTSLQPITFKCSHYLNGTGVAKPGDVLYDYLTNTIYGGAVPSANVNSTQCTALNTYSDQTITYTPSGGGSATQARYRINGVLNTGETVLNNVDKILTACDSWLAYQAATGQWSPVINKAESSSFSFDDSNIIGEIRVSVTDLSASINQIEVSFPFKSNKDQPEFVYLQTPSGLLYPNEPVNKYTTTFDLVNDSVQATYLANRILEQAREDLIVSFATAYPGIQVNAGDVISVTNSAYGWSSKLFRVVKVQEASTPDGNLGARVEATEYNADVYDDASITQFTPAPNSSLPSPYYFPTLATPTVTDQAPTASIPTFAVNTTVPSTGRVTALSLFYTTSSTPSASDWKQWGVQTLSNSQAFTPSSTVKFADISLPAATYYFAVQVSNEQANSTLSTASSSLTWNPTGMVGPTGPTGASITGPTGGTGNSARICYTKTTLSSLASTPTTITTSGSTSYPPNDSWGTGTVWGATAPTIVAGESVYQSDGIYSPATGNTVWNVPYLSALKVGQLSAISADLGTITAGTITVDSSGFIRGGQTAYNTGVGFFLGYSGGTYKLSIGDASGNKLLWDGTNLTLSINQSNVTLVGPVQNGSFFSYGYVASGTATAGLQFRTDGTLYKKVNSGSYSAYLNWYSPTTANIGNSYWVNVSKISGDAITSGTLDTWLALSSNQSFSLSLSSTGVAEAQLGYQISTSSSGTPVVATGTMILSVENGT